MDFALESEGEKMSKKNLISGAQVADAYATMLYDKLKGRVPDVVCDSACRDYYERLREEKLGVMLTDENWAALKKTQESVAAELADQIVKHWDVELDEETKQAMLADARQAENP